MPTAAIAKTSTPDAAAGNPVDVVTLNPGAGTADRQVVAIGDPTTGTNYAAVSAAGAISDNLAQLAGTTVDVNSGLKSAGTLRVVLATDQPALTNKLLVTPDSVALPANQSVNAAQFGGTNVVTGTGASAAGVPRVTVSNDSSLAANQSVNVNQIGGAAVTEGQKTMAASLPVVLASDQTALPPIAEIRAATLHVTGTAAVNTALTITLPAAGAGLFHYITSIEWTKLYSVIGVANAAGILITSTNLPGNPVWMTEQVAGGAAGSAGTAGSVVRVIDYHSTTPLKSSVANTATTIVAPLQLQTIWRGNVSYFTGV